MTPGASSIIRSRQNHAVVKITVRPPFGGSGRALQYLSRYTHRVAISNQRLVSFEQDQVTFRRRDSAHGNQQRLLTLDLDEFLRRFLPSSKASCVSTDGSRR